MATRGEPPLVWLIVGPNGAGKSTYYETRIKPRLDVPFVNADLLQRKKWPNSGMDRAYDAARLAAKKRSSLLKARRSFVAETVFSHPSKLELLLEAKRARYEVWVTLVSVASAKLSVARVEERVVRGGHPVPPDKIVERYDRLGLLVVRAIKEAHRGFVVDNTELERPLRDVLGYERGELAHVFDPVPRWAKRLFSSDLKRKA